MEAVLGYAAQVDHATVGGIAKELGGSDGLEAADSAVQNMAMQNMAEAMLADPAQSLARLELYLYAARRSELAEAMA